MLLDNELITEQEAEEEKEEKEFIENKELAGDSVPAGEEIVPIVETQVANDEANLVAQELGSTPVASEQPQPAPTAPVVVSPAPAESNNSVPPSSGPSNNNRANNNFNGPRRGRKFDDGFIEKLLEVKRINKTTKGGRRMRFSALAIVGDKNGKIGYGKGKSVEVPEAIKKAMADARNNIISNIIINKKNKSIYHEITCSCGATNVLLKPAPQGTGLLAGGAIRTILELAGYENVVSKKIGANSKINMIKATIKCLQKQRQPRDIAAIRGKGVKEL